MILGILGSILSGGATGLLGTAIQRFADHQNKKLDIKLEESKFTHDLALKKVDAEIMSQEWASRTKVAEVEASASIDVEESKAFAASFNEPQRYSENVAYTKNQGWLMVILDFVRGGVRPFLTLYLCALTTAIYIQAKMLLKENELSITQAYDLINTIINTILYLTTTVILWWFGTRNKEKRK